MAKRPYPSALSDQEWNFVAIYLALIDEQAPQRRYSLREVFNALRWLARAGARWRLVSHDLPPSAMVYQQFRLWQETDCFEALLTDMRSIIRATEGRSSPALASWMAKPCEAAARASQVRGTMATNGARPAKCKWLSIRWAICWR